MPRKVTVSTKVDEAVRDDLEAIAKQRRMETGEVVRVSDLLREALTEYVSRELPKTQQ
jgi:hypothetical protein